MDAKGSMGFEGNGSQFMTIPGRAREFQFTAGGRYRDPANITGIQRHQWRKSFVLGAFPRILLGD
jgi:hypothetical protein